MKKFVMLCLAASAVALATPASARTFVVDESPSRFIACYDRQYVPARVRVNTRGRLVRAASRSWEIAGERWDHVRNPGTYIQTRRTIEPDHFTLVRRGC